MIVGANLLMEICVKLGFVWNGFFLSCIDYTNNNRMCIVISTQRVCPTSLYVANTIAKMTHLILNRNDTQEICVALIFHHNFNVASWGPETTREWCDNHAKANRHCAATCETSENGGGLTFWSMNLMSPLANCNMYQILKYFKVNVLQIGILWLNGHIFWVHVI